MGERKAQTSNGARISDIGARDWRLLIDGALVSGATSGVSVDPSTGSVLADIPEASAEQVDAAVAAAAAAQPEWADLPIEERAATVRQIASALEDHAEELVALDAVDAGIPLRSMGNEIRMAVDLMNMFAGHTLALSGQTMPRSPGRVSLTTRQPYGVVGRIVPFNHPLFFAASRIAAPLIAGNAVVLKPSDLTPLSALRLGEFLVDLVPSGVVNIISGDSRVGERLVCHSEVRRLAFTGSVSTGLAVQRAAADSGRVKSVSLELGGKNALIVMPDVDVAAAARGAVAGMNFTWQGQSCGSTSRLLVHESIAEEVVAAVVTELEKIVVGPPLEPDTTMGPLVSAAHQEKVLAYIASGVANGAQLVTGGGTPDLPGWYVEPTVFDQVRPDQPIAQEEIFGPVLSVFRFSDEADAVALANDVEYGLTASVWTQDLDRAFRVVDALNSGYVWVNEVGPHYWGMPFGGTKNSGTGREESLDELLSYTEQKSVHVRFQEAAR